MKRVIQSRPGLLECIGCEVIKLEYSKEYNLLRSEQEKKQYLTSMLGFVANELAAKEEDTQIYIEKLKAELKCTKEELSKANNTIDRARILYQEAKEDIDTASRRTRKEIYKDLQIVRDRICAIIEIATSAGERMEKDGRARLNIEELNNILNAAGSIIGEMENLELWTESDEKPEIREYKSKDSKRIKKNSKAAKKESHSRQEDQFAIVLE